MRKAFVLLGQAAMLMAAVAMMASCAGDVDLVDRVQPGVIKKSDLLGSSWYYRRTVVDAPETMGPYAAVGTGDLFTIERVRWQIQEKYLIAYRDYEWTPGSEEAELPGSDYYGSPVAAFPITKQFDIIRQYNPGTNEETNVRVENSSDRVWSDRDYVRVNWAKNATPTLDFILPIQFLDLPGSPGAEYYVHEDDAVNPHRARIEPESGYMDFVNNHFVMPDVYTCYYDYDFNVWQAFSCGAGEIRIRHAFMKIDNDREAAYEPMYYPDSVTLKDANGNDIADTENGGVVREPVFERFGYYRLDRLTFDDERGLTESGKLYRMIRFDIWENSLDANGASIPYASRTPRPVVYYLNWDFPEKLKSTASEVAAEWNDVFKGTVASLQNKEITAVPDMFVLRENSCSIAVLNNYLASHEDVGGLVQEELDAREPTMDDLDHWCSATEYFSRDLEDRFVWQQMGDPRFNMLYWITHITPAAFAGYGPMLGDPISGRNVTSTSYLMGWTIENAATRALEYVDFINGDLTIDNLLQGSDAPNIFDLSYDSRAATFALEDVFERSETMVDQGHLENLSSRMQGMGGNYQARMTPLENSAHFAERLARVQGSDLEKNYLIRNEDLMVAAKGQWSPGQPIPDELWGEASFANRVRGLQATRDRTTRLLEEHTMCPMADLDSALVGLAKKLKDLPREERRDYLLKAYFKAVALHEVGHNVGLRHNFEGSYDSLNYHRKFWDLETSGLSQQDKLDAQQPEFMYSSIMDYHGKTNGDFQGLGAYDNAAIKFGYGQILETFSDPAVDGNSTLRNWMWEHDYRELLLPSDVDGHEDNHPPYFTAATFPAAIDKIYNRTDIQWDWRTEREEAPLRAKLHNEVPYMFCSDEYAGRLPTCKRFDFGANQRQVQASNYVRYKNYFLFTNYLRYRLNLDWNRTTTRGYAAFRDTNLTYQYMYLYSAKDDNFQAGTDLGADMATAVANGLNMMSEVLAMPTPNTYYRCWADPAQPDQDVIYYSQGYIKWDPLGSVTGLAVDPLQEVFGPEFGIGPEGELCSLEQEVDFRLGQAYPLYFGFSEDYVTWTFTYLGTYWDKQFALLELTDPLAIFYRENQEEDFRTYSVSLYRLYPDEVNDVLLGLIEYDRVALASGYNECTGEIMPKTMVNSPAAIGTGVTPPTCSTSPGMARVSPALARNLQLYSLLFGMAYLTSPLDETLDFAKHTRVALKGSPEDFTVFEEASSVVTECRLPESGRTYRALQTASEGSRIDIGYNFVNQCNTDLLAERYALTDYETKQATLDAWELANGGMDNTNPVWVDLYKESDIAWVEWERRDFELRQTEQTLMFMRELNKYYEFGAGF